ncbi:TRAP transporter small permease [Microvirga sp. BT689]|uniref:TRAP transporter small permease n=1 Tax=Microvirga arvi TaxID=2778731 RepID=UPI00194E8D77|nr:TRAP transporter small permease [Microvirga arvi]MBM6581199.1 TRAP transporter small permease [Microvirga arvi]
MRLLLLIASILVAATVGLSFVQVVLRYIFNNPQAWSEEVGRYLFVWITFLGSAVAFARDSHIKVDAIPALLGPAGMRISDILRRLVELAAIGMLLYSGIIVAWRNRFSFFYTIPDAPQVLFYLAVPVGSFFMFWYILRGLIALRS